MYMVKVLEREMNTKQKQQQQNRRFDRRNAIKNFDYDAWSPSQSPSSSFETYRTQSVDVSPLSGNRTSFRIEGTDGELDRICSYLGLSGPEDFAIPAAAWETRKARPYHFPSSRLSSEGGSPDAFEGRIAVSKCSRLKNGVGPAKSEARVREIGVVRHDDGELRVSVRGSGDGGCGIRGARPPLLAPPPAMPRSVIDNVSSTWDIFWSFGPQGDEDLGSPTAIRLARVLKEEEREIQEDEYGIDEQTVLSESCSDTSNDDKDEMAMELVYSVSPDGTFKRSIKSWQKGDFLGRGSFGTVHEGFTDDGFFFAVKEVSLLDQGSQGKQSIYQLEQEISLLSQFEHENIVQYLGTDKDDSKLYIFLELVTKGSLANLYQKYNFWDSQVSAYTRQILNGLNYLHGRNVVHRDIKCANILVDASGLVKLADFGLAKATKLNDIKSCKGTAFWMAPEVVKSTNHGYGLAADIWSLGCTVLEMLTHKIPYSHLEPMQAVFRIGKGEPPLIPSSLSSEAQDFIFKCLQVVPDDRPTAAQLLDHPFVNRPLSAISIP